VTTKYLYQYLSDNAFQAFIARGHHLKIKGCDRSEGKSNEWESLSLLYKKFNDFNEVTQKFEEEISIFYGIILQSIFDHSYPGNVACNDLQNLWLCTHEGYREVNLDLKKTSYAGFGPLSGNDPTLTINGDPIVAEKREYITTIQLDDTIIYNCILSENQYFLPFFIFPFEQPIPFIQYVDMCNDHLINIGNLIIKEIEEKRKEILYPPNTNKLVSFEEWKEMMIV
jgi:hypothetical protein